MQGYLGDFQIYNGNCPLAEFLRWLNYCGRRKKSVIRCISPFGYRPFYLELLSISDNGQNLSANTSSCLLFRHSKNSLYMYLLDFAPGNYVQSLFLLRHRITSEIYCDLVFRPSLMCANLFRLMRVLPIDFCR